MPASFLCGASAGLQKMCVPVKQPSIFAFALIAMQGNVLFYTNVIFLRYDAAKDKPAKCKISKSAEGLTHSFVAQK